MSKVLAAHQPNFMPYLGFFDKLRKADVLVIRDECLYIERDFHDRNRVRINSDDNVGNPKFNWIGVSVERAKDYLKNISIRDGKRGKRHWKEQLEYDLKVSYGNSPHFERHYPALMGIVSEANSSLVDLNMDLIRYMADQFGIKTPMVFASELGLKPDQYEKSDPSVDLVNICKALDASVYLSGNGAKAYLDSSTFENAGIEVRFQDFSHPTYQQMYPGFLPYMSAIDALFCVGRDPTVNPNE